MGQLRIEHYAGLKANAHAVIGIGFGLWFSYNTCVAFAREASTTVPVNIWGATTGRHMKKIPHDARHRMPYQEFQRELKKFLDEHGLAGE